MRCKMTILNVLIACEESQRVCTEFRRLGHNAYSCDIVDCSGGHPEWHIKQDVIPLLNGRCTFKTCDGAVHKIDGKWNLIIAHPPCTYLTNCATRSYSLRCTPAEKVVERWERRALAAVFFMRFILAECERIAVENPVGFMSKAFRKPDQIIEPYYFAKNESDTENYVTKRTCLWLKGLPTIKGNELPKPKLEKYVTKSGKVKSICWEMSVHGSDARSKTFPGIAKAMAEQWSEYILNNMSN